jgi:enoyl-CoA hydratase/carnithine racemase
MSAELKASRHDTALILTLSNPAARNALHPDMYAALIEALSTAERDATVRAVILTGADNVFCSGGSLDTQPPSRIADLVLKADSSDHLHHWVEAIRDCAKPVLAAIEGEASGAGFSLALACDLVVAGTSARFGVEQRATGRMPYGGCTWFLGRALPHQLATEIMLGSKNIPASRLQQVGLINRLAADGTALDAALSWADELAVLPPNAVEHIKSLLREATVNSLNQHLHAEKQNLLENL